MFLSVSADNLALFIAHLAKCKYTASTVFTFISAISYVSWLSSFPDPTQCSTIKLALKGYSKLNPIVADSRLPITLPLLERIINAFSNTVSGDYHRKLMEAMCAMAFFAALRVEEINFHGGQSTRNVIQLNQISFLASTDGKTSAIKLTMRFFKHSNPTQPIEILLHKSQPICPVATITEYLSVRGQISGPLFCWPDHSPVRRSQFVDSLKGALSFCNLETDRYKTHSFRIGAASWAAAQGFSDSQIRRFGRWKSNTFLKYIRTPSL